MPCPYAFVYFFCFQLNSTQFFRWKDQIHDYSDKWDASRFIEALSAFMCLQWNGTVWGLITSPILGNSFPDVLYLPCPYFCHALYDLFSERRKYFSHVIVFLHSISGFHNHWVDSWTSSCEFYYFYSAWWSQPSLVFALLYYKLKIMITFFTNH